MGRSVTASSLRASYFLMLLGIINGGAVQAVQPTPKLSDTGVFSAMSEQRFAGSVVPYQVISPLWSDGSYKTRGLWLPSGTKIDFSRDGSWTFPLKTVMIKNFYMDLVANQHKRQIIETRFLIKESAEHWTGYSYRWNENGTEATLLPDRATRTLNLVEDQQNGREDRYTYEFPNGEDCTTCHVAEAGFVLGLKTAQLNTEHPIGEQLQNQLRTFSDLDLFSTDIGNDFDRMPRLVDPMDESADLDSRARSYLDANCSNCHRPEVVGRTVMDMRSSASLEEMDLLYVYPAWGYMDSEAPSLITPGQPENSILFLRMADQGAYRMPKLASSRLDEKALFLMRRWIMHLGGETADTAVSSALTSPVKTHLHQNIPNPLNPHTIIGYDVDRAGLIKVDIYNMTGQKVRTLFQGEQMPGYYTAYWDGRDEAGAVVGPGVYLYQLQAGKFRQVRKMTVLK